MNGLIEKLEGLTVNDYKEVKEVKEKVKKVKEETKSHYYDIPLTLINLNFNTNTFTTPSNDPIIKKFIDDLNIIIKKTELLLAKDLHVTVFFGKYGEITETDGILSNGSKNIVIGNKSTIKIIGYGLDENAFVLLVECEDTFNPIPHCTLALRKGVQAKDSIFAFNNKDIWEKEKRLVIDMNRVTLFDNPITYEGIITKQF